jgi:AcrR family transcriptional regulator
MLVEQGDDLQLNRLAERAGVGVGTVYRHFPDLQSLREGLAAESLAGLVDDARAAAADADPSRGLERLLRAGLRLQLGDPVLLDVLCGPSPVCAETLELSGELVAAMNVILKRCRASGAIAGEITADDLRRLLGGVVFAARAGDATKRNAQRYFQLMLAALINPQSRT